MALNSYIPVVSVLLVILQAIDCFQWSQIQQSSHVISPYLGTNTTLPCDFVLSTHESQEMQQFHVILWSRRINSPTVNYWQALASITNINNAIDNAAKIIYPDQKKFSLRNNSLVVYSVDIDDEGQYQCEVKSSFYTTPTVVKLNVQYKPVGTQLIASKTKVTINKEGFELNCTAHANPKAGYSFFLNGKLVQNSTSHRHAIEKANKQNTGEYACIPWNFYGDGPNATVNIELEDSSKKPVGQALSDEVIAGITGAAALAVIIIVAVAIICKRMRDDKKPEPAKSTSSLSSPSDASEAHIGPGIYGSEASINDKETSGTPSPPKLHIGPGIYGSEASINDKGTSDIYTPSPPKLYKLNGQTIPTDTNL